MSRKNNTEKITNKTRKIKLLLYVNLLFENKIFIPAGTRNLRTDYRYKISSGKVFWRLPFFFWINIWFFPHADACKKLCWCFKNGCNTISKSKMISRRHGGGNEAYYTYVEEADNAPGIHRHSPGFPAGLRC